VLVVFALHHRRAGLLPRLEAAFQMPTRGRPMSVKAAAASDERQAEAQYSTNCRPEPKASL